MALEQFQEILDELRAVVVQFIATFLPPRAPAQGHCFVGRKHKRAPTHSVPRPARAGASGEVSAAQSTCTDVQVICATHVTAHPGTGNEAPASLSQSPTHLSASGS